MFDPIKLHIILKVLQKIVIGEIYSFYIDLKSNARGLRWASNRIEPFILHWDNVLVLTSHNIGSTPLEWLVAFWGLTYNILVKTTNSLFQISCIFSIPTKRWMFYTLIRSAKFVFPNWEIEIINLYKGVLKFFTGSVCTIIAINWNHY